MEIVTRRCLFKVEGKGEERFFDENPTRMISDASNPFLFSVNRIHHPEAKRTRQNSFSLL